MMPTKTSTQTKSDIFFLSISDHPSYGCGFIQTKQRSSCNTITEFFGKRLGRRVYFWTEDFFVWDRVVEEVSDMVQHLTSLDFDSVVGGSGVPVVVDFWAQWCPPCRFLGPVFEKVAGMFSGKVKFCKLDVDASRDVAARFNIQAVPTLIVFKDGREMARQEGALPEEALIEWIRSVTGVEE